MSLPTPEQLHLFKSFFRGREDVFAVRWEKNGKGNYMPAFNFDLYRYKLHQSKGGTFQTFQEKTYKPLVDQELRKQPFIYLLISGTTQYHIVWETLDTEKATYIWHIEKSIQQLTLSPSRIGLPSPSQNIPIDEIAIPFSIAVNLAYTQCCSPSGLTIHTAISTNSKIYNFGYGRPVFSIGDFRLLCRSLWLLHKNHLQVLPRVMEP